MSEYVIRSLGLVGQANVAIGKDTGYVKTYDPEAHDGQGEVVFTDDPAQALRFATPGLAFVFVSQVPRRQRMRPDGRPNRPLTAFSVSIEPIEEGGVHDREEAPREERRR